ncbi:MAG: hypothetical protein HY475_01690 [Candidatus Terrybacteria bacterium]|nr:hypothetical protein [Candidatus Terrybacteria bacterium]
MAESTVAQLRQQRDYAAIARCAVRDIVKRLYGGDFRGLKVSYDTWAFSGGKVPQPDIAAAVRFWFSAQESTGIVFTSREYEEIDHEIEAHIRKLCEEN